MVCRLSNNSLLDNELPYGMINFKTATSTTNDYTWILDEIQSQIRDISSALIVPSKSSTVFF